MCSLSCKVSSSYCLVFNQKISVYIFQWNDRFIIYLWSQLIIKNSDHQNSEHFQIETNSTNQSNVRTFPINEKHFINLNQIVCDNSISLNPWNSRWSANKTKNIFVEQEKNYSVWKWCSRWLNQTEFLWFCLFFSIFACILQTFTYKVYTWAKSDW